MLLWASPAACHATLPSCPVMTVETMRCKISKDVTGLLEVADHSLAVQGYSWYAAPDLAVANG